MTHASLFTGIGGFDLAAKWMGWENVFQVEKDPFCIKTLEKNFPNAKRYTDIREFDGSPYKGRINVLSGGDPCQPHSIAGNRAGKSDERYLWPEYRRVYNEVEAGVVVNENVPGSITNGVLDQKIIDLENDGYTCWPALIIPAGATGTLHRRDRVWLVAYSMRQRREECNTSSFSVEEAKGAVRNNPLSIVDNWATCRNADKSTILRMANGLPDRLDRNKRIKALGNAVVPQVVYQIFQAIQQYQKIKI